MDYSTKECVLEWIHGNKTVSVTAAPGSSLKYRIMKYAGLRPEEVQVVAENKDGYVFAKIPLSWIRIAPPRKMTPEQAEAARERLKAAREKQNS